MESGVPAVTAEQLERRIEIAERRLADARADARSLATQNERLNTMLREARSRLVALKGELEALASPPLSRGVVVSVPDAETPQADVVVASRRLRVAVSAELAGAEPLRPGDGVLVNDAMVIVARVAGERTGSLAVVVEQLPDQGGVVVRSGDAEHRLRPAASLLGIGIEGGDSVLVDLTAGLVLDVVARVKVTELVLDEVPDVSYDDIGGLGRQIEQIRDAVELPFLHRDRYRRYQLTAPKGILLYGPPGCGKTMIAKAVANSLGREGSYFLNIKGPELLNKFVGETERQIRLIFGRARELASEGKPVIVFFDEMDSLFRTRGSGISSDIENTIVAQLLSEIDGVEGLDNVIIIGASNREDMIDPAILRPGRLDQKIKLDRPDAEGARQILGKYLTVETPLSASAVDTADGSTPDAVANLIDVVVSDVYAASAQNRFLEVTFASGAKDVLYFADFVSGAMLHNIVDRAKKLAIKDELAGGAGGVSAEGLRTACRAEFAENEDLPNTTNPDDWARIAAVRGERVVFVRTLVAGSETSRALEVVDR